MLSLYLKKSGFINNFWTNNHLRNTIDLEKIVDSESKKQEVFMDETDSAVKENKPGEVIDIVIEEKKVIPVRENGVYSLDFRQPPLIPTHWEIAEHNGELFEYKPMETVLFTLKDLGYKTDTTISNCIKKLKKLGIKPMVANAADFISSSIKPTMPGDFIGTYSYFLGTIFKNQEDLFVRSMLYNDYSKEWIKRYEPVSKKLTIHTRIICYE